MGERGERIAARWLRRSGYRILHRNLRCGRDEADLIVLDPDGSTVVVVEVKTSASGHVPEERVNAAKVRCLQRIAARCNADRIDIVAVELQQDRPPIIRHHAAAIEDPRS